MTSSGGSGGEIRLSGPFGATIIIGEGVDPYSDGYDFVDFPVSILADGLSATTHVRSVEGDTSNSLHRFLQEIADDWKGTENRREWEAIEHDLTIEADRDSLGHVRLTFNLRESCNVGSWVVSATVQLDAGEEMATLAQEAKRMLRR